MENSIDCIDMDTEVKHNPLPTIYIVTRWKGGKDTILKAFKDEEKARWFAQKEITLNDKDSWIRLYTCILEE